MELCYSLRGLPYVMFEDGAIFIFSDQTSTDTHYKYLVYSGLSISTLTTTVSAGKGKNKVKKPKIVAREPVKFIVPVSLKGIPREAKKAIAEDELEVLSDTIRPFLEDGLFPKSKIGELELAIKQLDAEE